MSIVALAPEVLAQISALCEGADIGALYMCGSTRLNRLMEVQGGVKYFSVDFSDEMRPRFPRIAGRLRQLESLVIHGISAYSRKILDVDLTILPPTITNLDLRFPNSLPSLFKRKPESDPPKYELLDLKVLFPRLRKLNYSNDYGTQRNLVPVLPDTIETLICHAKTAGNQDLPRSVLDLTFYSFHEITELSPTFFPPFLTSLAVHGHTPFEPGHIKDMPFAPYLKHLSVDVWRIMARVDEFQPMEFPPYLESLLLAFPPSYMRPLFPKAAMTLVPRSLTSFQITGNASLAVDALEVLPPNLRRLSVHVPLYSQTYDIPAILGHMPRTMTEWTREFQQHVTSTELMKFLPPRLQHFVQYQRDWNVDLSLLPSSIRSIELTARTKTTNSDKKNEWKNVSLLTQLKLNYDVPVSVEWLHALAEGCPFLKDLELGLISPETPEHGQSILAAIPAHLQRLSVHFRTGMVPFTHNPELPLRLTKLNLWKVDTSRTDKTAWLALPRSVKALHVTVSHAHELVKDKHTGLMRTDLLQDMCDGISHSCLHLTTLKIDVCKECEEVTNNHIASLNTLPLRKLTISKCASRLTKEIFELLPQQTLMELSVPTIADFDTIGEEGLGSRVPLLRDLWVDSTQPNWFSKERMESSSILYNDYRISVDEDTE